MHTFNVKYNIQFFDKQMCFSKVIADLLIVVTVQLGNYATVKIVIGIREHISLAKNLFLQTN